MAGNAQTSVLVVTYWSFHDALIQTYTLPYVKRIAQQLPAGSKVFLVTLDKTPPQTPPELAEWNIEVVSIAYQPFGLRGLWMWLRTLAGLARLIRRERVGTIHAWCTPAGMIGYLLSIWTRRRLIIDSYEPHAEAMVENGTWKKGGLAFRVLFFFEKRLTKRATWLIAATEGMRHYAREKYGHTGDNYFVKPACTDLELFSPVKRKDADLVAQYGLADKITCVYAGKFGGIYLDREVFAFFKAAQTYWGKRFQVLLLTNHDRSELDAFATEAGFDTKALTTVFVPHSDVPRYLGLGDFGFTPVKPVPTKRYCTPIKDGEYWALGLPVVITANISDDSDLIAANNAGSILHALTPESYAQSVREIDTLLQQETPEERAGRIRQLAERYRNFRIAETIYAQIYGNDEA